MTLHARPRPCSRCSTIRPSAYFFGAPQAIVMLILVPFTTVAPERDVCALMWNFLNFVDGSFLVRPSWQPALRKASRACATVMLSARGTTHGVASAGATAPA